MPIDQPEATSAPTNRRTFLTRAALGGALVGVGAAAGPFGLLAPAAGAQDAPLATVDEVGALTNETFAAFAVPMEMAAVQAYQLVLASEQLEGPWPDLALDFQGHHQTVVDSLTAQLAEGLADPVANPILLAEVTTAIETAGSPTAVLLALSELEDAIAATHLYCLGGLEDTSLAKVVAQVLAVESQQAATLGLAGEAPDEQVTPATVGTEAARTNLSEGAVTAPPATTTTTAASEETTTTEAGN